MAATSYQSLYPYIVIDVPGASGPLIDASINLAARELCLKSSCWNEYQTILLEANVNRYDITPPTNSATVRYVKTVRIGTRVLKPEMENILYEFRNGLLTSTGEPICYFLAPDLSLQVFPTPTDVDAGKEMIVLATFIPGLDATEIDSVLVDRFSEALICGAKGRIFAIPGQPWSNPQMALAYDQQFNELVTKARIDVELSYGSGSLHVRRRAFNEIRGV